MTKRLSKRPKGRDASYRVTDWMAGYKAGSKGEANNPPPNTDAPSWAAGYLAHFIRRSFACDSKGGDEAVGLA